MYVYICSETCVNTNTRGGATFGREKRGGGLEGGIHGPGPAAYESAAAFKVRSGLDCITLVDWISLDLHGICVYVTSLQPPLVACWA